MRLHKTNKQDSAVYRNNVCLFCESDTTQCPVSLWFSFAFPIPRVFFSHLVPQAEELFSSTVKLSTPCISIHHIFISPTNALYLT